jgi:hypothetical protein
MPVATKALAFSLPQMSAGGEYGELAIELAATLAAAALPVRPTERDELLALLDATGMPTDPIRQPSAGS